ncbi:dipeptidase PepE [Sediminibacter sp. Hel_I_10]|uniref:dipeptidase PepE n=1 Tax=Sediminibacter sp. Hel_I_10 TaxID=1392490 RepID=UPI00047EF02A|nr:dipeptidase PepE [Sediminibacter sp. Hel_I_10]
MKNIIIASTSTLHGSGTLEYLLEDLSQIFKDTSEILFIPYARPSGISHDDYTERVTKPFHTIDKTVKGIHEFENAIAAVKDAKAIFVGGGNTFLLVSQLYKHQLLEPITTVVKAGTPYLGTSAGSNICGLTMNTTNDMPIVYPPSFKTFGFVPFNINPHYLDPDLNSTHKGETRETRIKEFHQFNTQPVVGLREGSWLRVQDKSILLKGDLPARVFEHAKAPYEISPETDLKDLK